MRRPGRNLLLSLSFLLVLPALAAGGRPPTGAQPGGPPLPIQPGDRIEIDGIGLIVPEAGMGVWGAALRPGEGGVVAGVETSSDGTVVIHRSPPPSGAPVKPGRGACSDGAYSLNGDDWNKSFRWSFNRGSTPSEVERDNATDAVQDGVKNVTRADNDCGLGDKVSATQEYLGSTNEGANIGTNSTCKPSDGRSVIGFGNLLATDLAFTCWWTRNGAITEGDIRFNKTEFSWVVNIGNLCLTKFSVEGVVTHEVGHVFGLGHVSEVGHGSLTMSTVIMACQSSERSLGLGDLKGLEALY